ncbi:MAG: histidine--tRNA ligase, partial [Janthinobacterium lividum]
RDLLPDQTPLWNRVEAIARAVFARYGFGEIRTPVFEATELFSRGVGEETDIVSKEMFTWEDAGRFDEGAMQSAWLKQNEIQVGLISRLPSSPAHLLVEYLSSNTLEVVGFKTSITQANVDQLRTLGRETFVDREIYDSMHLRLVTPMQAYPHRASFDFEGVELESMLGTYQSGGQTLCLRPESTAGVMRAYIEHKLGDTGNLQKLYYIGPQFRRERPQRGRYRQFWQIGAEVIGPQSSGAESPLRDAEVLEMLASLLDELGVRGWRLELNSVGNTEDRVRYNTALREALAPVKDQLCPDNQRRAETNPLRVLDSKDEADQAIINGLPKIADYLGPESKAHFEQVLAALDACGVEYHVNPRLVRGLDYYTRTTFEFTVTTGLGTQNALLGGGRYDGLSEILGGPRAPGIGFAIGEDRLILTLQAQAELDAAAGQTVEVPKLDAYIAPLGISQNAAALALARELRRAGLGVEVGDGSFKMRKSFEVADKLARSILILGEDEVRDGSATVKTFATGEQRKVERSALVAALR